MTKTEIIKGKVKTVFSTAEPDKVLIQYEDKVTAGNGKKELIVEDKGRICCEISSIIFQKLEEAFGLEYFVLGFLRCLHFSTLLLGD